MEAQWPKYAWVSWIIIGSGYGLLPGRQYKTITETDVNCTMNKLPWNLYHNTSIFIQQMYREMGELWTLW